MIKYIKRKENNMNLSPNYFIKLTDDQLLLITALIRQRISYEYIVTMYPEIALSKCVYHALIYNESNDYEEEKIKEFTKNRRKNKYITQDISKGENNIAAKLTIEQVKQIKQYYREGKTYPEIKMLMPDLPVTQALVSHIKYGRTWKDVE